MKYKTSTAYSRVGRLTSQHSYSAANFFPFDEYHELFMSRKHDLSELTFDEFKDLLGLPAQWFAKVHALNATLKYPVVMWDYLDKGGASQMHPHCKKKHGHIFAYRMDAIVNQLMLECANAVR